MIQIMDNYLNSSMISLHFVHLAFEMVHGTLIGLWWSMRNRIMCICPDKAAQAAALSQKGYPLECHHSTNSNHPFDDADATVWECIGHPDDTISDTSDQSMIPLAASIAHMIWKDSNTQPCVHNHLAILMQRFLKHFSMSHESDGSIPRDHKHSIVFIMDSSSLLLIIWSKSM